MHTIRTLIVGPGGPHTIHSVLGAGNGVGYRADRCLFPPEIARKAEVQKELLEAILLLIDLHQGEELRLFAPIKEAHVLTTIAQQLWKITQERKQTIHLRGMEYVLAPTGRKPRITTLIITCSDGRGVFWGGLLEFSRKHPNAYIVSLPGEIEWLKDHPATRTALEKWQEEKDITHVIVAKHGGPCGKSGCGYRTAKRNRPFDSSEEEKTAALAECTNPSIEYCWQDGIEGNEPCVRLEP